MALDEGNTVVAETTEARAEEISVQDTKPDSDSASIAHPYRSLMADTSFPRCHQMLTPPGRAETFIRALYMLGNGFPLFYPAQIMHMQQDQPPKVCLTIGDVGYIDQEGQFTFYFNIYKSQSDPAQDFCPPDMIPIHPPPESTDILSVQVPPGTVFSSKGVDVFRRSSTPLDVTFTVKAREAAVLILQNGGLREDLISANGIRDYVQKHALKWYMFVNQFGPGNIICPNGSLYLVTGCDKANSWASSCYPLDYKQVGRVAANSRFQESLSNPWEDSINMECRLRSSDVSPEMDTLFIRGMKIAINVSQWAEHLLRNRPPQYISFYNVLTIPVVGIPARLQSFLEKRLKHPESYTSEPTELLFHPLEIILRYLIEEFPHSDVAILEDYFWASVTNPEAITRLIMYIVHFSLIPIKADSDVISISRLLIKILESNVVASQNGWVTLAPSSSRNLKENTLKKYISGHTHPHTKQIPSIPKTEMYCPQNLPYLSRTAYPRRTAAEQTVRCYLHKLTQIVSAERLISCPLCQESRVETVYTNLPPDLWTSLP